MVKFRKIMESETEVQYRYFPEGREPSGIAAYDKVAQIAYYVEIAEDDEYKWYGNHVLMRLREYAENGEFPESGMAAWY